MRLVLVRHGRALAGADDRSRLLSPEGRGDVERLALFLGTSGVQIEDICHSGLVRAAETAEILARSLSSSLRIQPIPGLDPDDPLEPILDRIEGSPNDMTLVGHLTHIERLTATLLGGDPDRPAVEFETATMVALTREDDGWTIEWVLRPELLGRSDLFT